MSDIITFNTKTGMINSSLPSDPWDHLPTDQWVQKQIEWGENNISGSGLVDPIKQLRGDLIGAEIGVCLGLTTELFAREISNLKKIYAIDSYPTFTDWNGVKVTSERQDGIKNHAAERLKPYMSKVELVYADSSEFAKTIEDEYLDFIFIDGDHSYEGALRDFKNFYPKIKKGGIFSGHDIVIPTVQKALLDFFGHLDVCRVSHDAWYIIKQ